MAHVSPENFSRTSAHDFERRRCADGSGILITAGAIGPAKIGSRISSIRENCTTRIVIRGGDSTLVISPAGGDVELTLSAGDSVVTRAETSDPAFRTEDGFGVGTKLAELRSKYGPACGVADTTAAFPALPGIVFHGRRDVEVIVAGESSGCK